MRTAEELIMAYADLEPKQKREFDKRYKSHQKFVSNMNLLVAFVENVPAKEVNAMLAKLKTPKKKGKA